MKLLIVTPFYKPAYIYGGPTRSVPSLAEAIAATGTEVTVFTTNANGKGSLDVASDSTVEVDGVSVRYFRRDFPGSYFFSTQLTYACFRQVSQFHLVYVISNWGFPFLPACSAAWRAKTPYVVTPRTALMRRTWKGTHVKKALYHSVFERILLNRASAIHYTSELEQAESRWLNLHRRSFIVPNPVSIDEFNHLPAKGQFRKKWNISSDSWIVLFLGRIEPRKGLDLTLQGFSQIVDVVPSAQLVIAGPEEDNYRATLQRKAKQLGVDNHLLFTGHLNGTDRLTALVDADVFILTSYSENFGMAVVEAMACGLPVIVSDQVGLADLIHQENAGLITQLEPESISTALLTLLQDPDLASKIGETGKIVARRSFAPDAVAQRMLQEFDNVLAARRPN